MIIFIEYFALTILNNLNQVLNFPRLMIKFIA